MKYSNLYKLPLVLISLILFACDNDDDNSQVNSSHFNYDSNNYNLIAGQIIDWGSSSGYSNFSIYLFTEDISWPVTEDINYSRVYFNIFSEEDLFDLQTGTYNFSSNSNEITSGTFDSASNIFIDINSNDEDIIDIESGVLEITQNGPIYELKFNLTTLSDEVITGYYNGSLVYTQGN